MSADMLPKLLAENKFKSAEEKLTFYSLYKQANEGNYKN